MARVTRWVALATASVVLFVWVRTQTRDDRVAAWDQQWFDRLGRYGHGDTRRPLLRLVVDLAGAPVVALALVAACVWLVRRGRGADAVFLGVSVAAAALVEVELKHRIERAAVPAFFPAYSFPSGHAAASAAVAVAAGVVLWRTRLRWAAAGGGLAYVAAVALASLVLDSHYPSEVLAGWAVGVGVVSVAAAGRAAYGRRSSSL